MTALNSDLESLVSPKPTFLTPQPPGTELLKSYKEKIRVFQAIAEASQEAFATLSRACSKHLEHKASLRVQADFAARNLLTLPQYEFDVLFTGSESQCGGSWYEIKMTLGEVDARVIEPSDQKVERIALSKRLCEELACTEPKPSRKKGKSVRLDLSCLVDVPQIAAPIQPDARQSSNDLCDCLRRWRRSPRDQFMAPMMYSDLKWRKVITPVREIAPTHNQPQSLRDVLALLSQNGDLRALSDLEKTRLAKTLCIGFLRHHTTDWGRPAWHSGNIFFYEELQQDQELALVLPKPHIHGRLCDERHVPDRTIEGISCDDNGTARNRLLFCLGILLLEIAFKRDWDHLREMQAHQRSAGGPDTEFKRARSIARSRQSGMPGQYHRIAEKLIECDFAHGCNLQEEELQIAFYQQVIDPLEDLERKLRSAEI